MNRTNRGFILMMVILLIPVLLVISSLVTKIMVRHQQLLRDFQIYLEQQR